MTTSCRSSRRLEQISEHEPDECRKPAVEIKTQRTPIRTLGEYVMWDASELICVFAL